LRRFAIIGASRRVKLYRQRQAARRGRPFLGLDIVLHQHAAPLQRPHVEQGARLEAGGLGIDDDRVEPVWPGVIFLDPFNPFGGMAFGNVDALGIVLRNGDIAAKAGGESGDGKAACGDMALGADGRVHGPTCRLSRSAAQALMPGTVNRIRPRNWLRPLNNRCEGPK
jgi:hypothetical protein